MFQLVLVFIVVPVRMFTAARSVGRNGFAWALAGVAVFLLVNVGIVLGSELIYNAAAYVYGWPEYFDEAMPLFAGFLNLFAMCCGMAGAEVLRYKLKNPSEPYYDTPPPPELFRTL